MWSKHFPLVILSILTLIFLFNSIFIRSINAQTVTLEKENEIKHCYESVPAGPFTPAVINCASWTTYSCSTSDSSLYIDTRRRQPGKDTVTPQKCPNGSTCTPIANTDKNDSVSDGDGIRCLVPSSSPAPSQAPIPQGNGTDCSVLDDQLSAKGQYARCTDVPTTGEVLASTYYCAPYKDPQTKESVPQKCYYSVKTNTPAPSGDNSCLDYDPGYTPTQTAEVFSCDTSSNPCSGQNQAKYASTSYNKCANGGVCCYNTVKYAVRKLQSTGTGNNPGGGSVPPAQESPAPSSDRCSAVGKGNVDTAFSKPDGFWGATCGGKFIGDTDPKTAIKGRQYADRYKCTKTGTDGTNYVDAPSSSPTDPANPCDKFPWIDTSVTPVCKAGVNGAVVNCADAYKDPSYTCTFDYNSSNTQNSSTLTHCCQNNKRYCDVAGTCVDEGQGCYAKLGLQDVCVKGNDTDCSDYAAGARCLDPDKNDIYICMYPPGQPTPTPTAGVAKNCMSGQKGTGCACDTATACGCAASHNPEPSLDDPTKYYCMPFPSTGMKWCSVTKSAMPSSTDPAVCKGSTPYSTPTPPSKGCPNDGNHLCVDTTGTTTNQCVSGFGPGNDLEADKACAGWNASTPTCYVRGATPKSVCTVTPSLSPSPSVSVAPSVSPKPFVYGCPNDNGDGRVNSCQASCTGSYPNPRNDKQPGATVGDCEAAYGAVRGACCTSK